MKGLTIKHLQITALDRLKNNRFYGNCSKHYIDRIIFTTLEYLTGLNKLNLVINMDKILDSGIVSDLNCVLSKLESGMPIEHITGETEFMSLKFKVNQHTLIPRPETEKLVEKALENLSSHSNFNLNILDICSGTGCIGLTIAKYSDKVKKMFGVDISEFAIQIANDNKKTLGLQNCHFYQNDILKDFDLILNYNDCNKYDLIVSNPPYIRSTEIENLEENVVRFEPHIALDGGYDGLTFYRHIIKHTHEILKINGSIILEIGYDQADQVLDLIRDSEKYKEYCVDKDLFGNNRVVSAVLR